jgi:hypothetical protein
MKRESQRVSLFLKLNHTIIKHGKIQKTKCLKEKLPSILAWFEASARELKAHWDENERREKAEAEKKRIEQEAQQRIENEVKKFNILIDEAERWQKAKNLRDYIAYLETNNISNHDDFSQWLEWAKKKADWYDPLVKDEDEILGYFESNTEK